VPDPRFPLHISRLYASATPVVAGLGFMLIAFGPIDLVGILLAQPRNTAQALSGTLTLIGFAAILLLPLRLAPLGFGWLLLMPALQIFAYAPNVHEANNVPFDRMFFFALRLGVIAIAGMLYLARGLVTGAWKWWHRGSAAPSASAGRFLRFALCAHGWIFAAFIALLLQFPLAQQLQGFRPAWLPHLLLSVLGLAFLSLLKPWPQVRALPLLRATLSGFGTGLLICLALEVGIAKSAMREAKRLAAGRPYCLQSAEHGPDYQVVLSLLDLSGLTMHAKADSLVYLQHHAVLVIDGREPLHWSYNRLTFLPPDGRTTTPVIHCDPEPDFGGRLTWLGTAAESATGVLISMHGRTFRIPEAFHPKASEAHAEIRIGAMAPDFAPLADVPQMGMDVLRLASLSFEPERWRYLTVSARYAAIEAAPEYGLAKRTLTSSGFPMTQHYSGDLNGIPDVFIECQPRGCVYLFVRDSLVYYFEGGPEMIPQWKELADRVEALFRSWEVVR